jgi:DNA mismatch repair protein MutS
MVKNHNILNEYLELVELYDSQYENSIVLLQVGSFYEMYSIIENDPKLKQICELLNIIMSKKNKTITRISHSNPHMAGIPCVALDKYLDILINNNYTVIVYNQYLDKKTIKRKLDRIYSIGTYIDSEKSITYDNLILSIYIEYSESKINLGANETFINGLSIIDLSTGSIKVLEIYNNDYTKLIEDLNKELIIYNPKEIIFTYNSNLYNSKHYHELLSFFKNKNCILHNNQIDKDYENIIYQNEFLKTIFQNILPNDTYLTPIEVLDLEKLTYIRISLITLLKFSYNHDNMIINNLNKPIIISNSKYLNLHNNALYQLNILSHSNNYKYNSLFDIINKTSTSLGKRYLKYNLTYPLLDIDELNNRYNLIDKLYNQNIYTKYENELNNILDIEKYHKKLGVQKLIPYQYGKLNTSYKAIINLIKLSKKHFTLFDYNILDNFTKYYDEYLHYFNISNLELYNYTNFQSNLSNNIFNDGVVVELDNLYNFCNGYTDNLNKITNKLSKLINNDKIELKYTDRDGYFLSLTKIRANKLKKILESQEINDQELVGIQFSNKTQSNTYITSKNIKQLSDNIVNNNIKIQTIMKNKYLYISISLFNKYSTILNYINYYISYIDLIKSFTKCSILNNYNKPEIIDLEKSFIECKEIRHPISEQLHKEYNYVTNDISLNDNKIGCLLYGSNGVGKSTLMKAVGLNIILAQIGCYVSASEFKYYPYSNLFTRIDHSDNLFKGLSSFESEILELKTILNYSDEYSLVLGDEILNSTENISAISIISASINFFLEKNISFIFASHLHQIPNHINPVLLNKLNISHLKMDYNPETKTFIYNRKMFEGMPMQNYGLIVAKSLLNNEYIINNSLDIQNTILNPSKNKIISKSNDLENGIKKSKYNKKVLLSNCYICNDLNIQDHDLNILETHHIIFQNDFENNKCNITSKSHIKKNQESNLVNLCKYHHLDVHKNKITINGWIKTSNGKKLDYIIN